MIIARWGPQIKIYREGQVSYGLCGAPTVTLPCLREGRCNNSAQLCFYPRWLQPGGVSENC